MVWKGLSASLTTSYLISDGNPFKGRSKRNRRKFTAELFKFLQKTPLPLNSAGTPGSCQVRTPCLVCAGRKVAALEGCLVEMVFQSRSRFESAHVSTSIFEILLLAGQNASNYISERRSADVLFRLFLQGSLPPMTMD